MTTLYNLGLISYRQFVKNGYFFLYDIIDTQRTMVDRPADCSINVRASIIPFREGHWITIGHLNINPVDNLAWMLPRYQVCALSVLLYTIS